MAGVPINEGNDVRAPRFLDQNRFGKIVNGVSVPFDTEQEALSKVPASRRVVGLPFVVKRNNKIEEWHFDKDENGEWITVKSTSDPSGNVFTDEYKDKVDGFDAALAEVYPSKIISGGNVTIGQNTESALTIVVDETKYEIGRVEYMQTAGEFPLSLKPPAGLFRIDVIYLDKTGLKVLSGNVSGVPDKPAVPDKDIEIASLLIGFDSLSISAPDPGQGGATAWGGLTGDIDNQQDLKSKFDGKVDKENGKGLSEENFSLEEKTKLAGLVSSKFKGSYPTLAALKLAFPEGEQTWYSGDGGETADVDTGVGQDVKRYIWDQSDLKWVEQGGTSIADPNTTLQGNEFNGPNQLVKLEADGALPAVSAKNLIDLPDGGSFTIVGNVQDYSSLPSGLAAADKNKAWLNEADGKLYIWDGTAFPANGSGILFRGPEGAAGSGGGGVTEEVYLTQADIEDAPKRWTWTVGTNGAVTVTDLTVNYGVIFIKGTNQLTLKIGHDRIWIAIGYTDNDNFCILGIDNSPVGNTFGQVVNAKLSTGPNGTIRNGSIPSLKVGDTVKIKLVSDGIEMYKGTGVTPTLKILYSEIPTANNSIKKLGIVGFRPNGTEITEGTLIADEVKILKTTGGGVGQMFDQDLNTYNSVEFAHLLVHSMTVDLPTSADGQPPLDILTGDVFVDLTNNNLKVKP